MFTGLFLPVFPCCLISIQTGIRLFSSFAQKGRLAAQKTRGSLQEFLVLTSKNSLSRIGFEKGGSTLEQRRDMKDISLFPQSALGRRCSLGQECQTTGVGTSTSPKVPVPHTWHRTLIKWPKEIVCLTGDLCGQMTEGWRCQCFAVSETLGSLYTPKAESQE